LGLTATLANLDVGPKSLWVVPSSEVRRRKVEDATAARREFGANLVVNGSLLRQGNTVRLVLNLIDSKNMRQMGSAEGEDRTGDYAAAQDQAVVRLARLMNLSVTREMIGGGASAKPAAYEAYLNGLGLLQRYDRAGNLDRAIAALESATSADPQFALAFASLGESYLLKFQTDQNARWLDQAAAQCRRAADLNDQLAPVHVTLGRVHNAQGHIDLALQEFDRALQLNPRNAEAIAGTARAYENQGRTKEAEETFRRAVVLRPDYWDGYNSLGQFYLRARRPADAVAQFQKVVALTPDNANGYLNLGAAYSADRKYGEAVQALESSIRIAPSYGAYTNLGNIYYRQKQWGEAARNYEHALQLNDQDWRPWLNLASAYEHLSRKDDENRARRRAVPLLEKSAAARPQDALLQSALGAEYAKLGERDKAAAKIEAGVALAPKDPDILHRAGDAYERAGNRAKAVDYINRALANGYSREDVLQDPDMKGIISDPRFKAPHTTERK
jgi:serine/threonine-protein kinase